MSAKPIPILITIPLSEALVQQIQEVSPRLEIALHPAGTEEEIPAEAWEQAEVLFTFRKLPELEQAPQLRWIQFLTAGIDKILDAPIMKKPELQATTLSGAAASQMAEYILTMFLALSRHLPAHFSNQVTTQWPDNKWERFSPQELRDSTVGIIGYGSIGRELTRLLQPFGVTVLATKRDLMQPADQGYIPEGLGDPSGDLARRLYPPQAIRSMLKECDFVVVTVPLTPDTLGLINAEVLAAMKPTAYLVDVSRGGVIDHGALISALQEGQIAGAGLDVFPEEPLPEDNPLWQLPNVIMTPHIAGFTTHYYARAVDLFCENLRRYIEGQPLFNLFDPVRGY